VASFREVSRVLAGFNDGRAGEGVGAGTPSQRGTVLAQQMGWTAPAKDDHGIAPATTTAAAAADSQQRAARSSGTDPSAPAADAHRAGAPAGKPPAETTAGEGDPGGGAAPKATPGKES
jgi:NADH-quinone oxidoreductase subunit E